MMLTTSNKQAKKNASERVRQYLKALPPLTPVTLQELYSALEIDSSEENAVRTGLYRQCVGTKVSRRHLPPHYFAICLEMNEIEPQFDIFLSLPEISRERLRAEAEEVADEIITRLQQHYGKDAINFWGRAAQRRSVDQAHKGMNLAKERDEFCRLCMTVNKLREERGLTPLSPKMGTASHVLSRRASFWTLLDAVHRESGNIFSDESANKFRERLTADPFHSHADYIIRLCHRHDALLRETLRRV